MDKGDNIITRYGCICKNKYKVDNITYIKTCNVHNTNQPWCMVQGECGSRVLSGKYNNNWYDHCNIDEPPSKLSNSYITNNIKGMVIFIIVFIVIIPYLLYISKLQNIIQLYFPNLTSIATSISYGYSLTNKGLRQNNIFQQLYNTKSDLMIAFINTNIINYISLLGLIYLIVQHVKLEYIVTRGWILFIVLLIFTYLLPEKVIIGVQQKIFDNIQEHEEKDSIIYRYSTTIVIIAGFLISILFMAITYYILYHLKENKLIHNFITFYKNIFT